MLQRLLEAHYLKHRAAPTPEQQRFWLLEMRTPELLCEVAQAAPQLAGGLATKRPLLRFARADKLTELAQILTEEERSERERDKIYWQPLKEELEQLRQAARKGQKET